MTDDDDKQPDGEQQEPLSAEEIEKRQREAREYYSAERLAYFEHWRLDVEPADSDRQALRQFAVQYAQITIRSGFILNGGGVIAVPAFAGLLGGGLWAKGTIGAIIMVGVLISGLIVSGFAAGLAFFATGRYSAQARERRDRQAQLVNHDFALNVGRTPSTIREELTEPTDKEKRYGEQGWQLERGAIICSGFPLVTFIVGALIAIYIMSGTPGDTSRTTPRSASSTAGSGASSTAGTAKGSTAGSTAD